MRVKITLTATLDLDPTEICDDEEAGFDELRDYVEENFGGQEVVDLINEEDDLQITLKRA